MPTRIFDLAPERAPDIKRSLFAGHTTPVADNVRVRLDWYGAFEAEEARRCYLFRDAREETEMQLMRRPIPTERAYALFGLLLGALPFAAVILRIFSKEFARRMDEGNWWELDWGWLPSLLAVLLLLDMAGGFFGKFFGASLGRRIDDLERRSWSAMFIGALVFGFLWGIMTGVTGGLFAVGIGAFFGACFAAPIGIAAFALFTPLHRLMARGGMIDARHFWPLACGVTLLFVAFILSPKF